jgi:hypothetical protein
MIKMDGVPRNSMRNSVNLPRRGLSTKPCGVLGEMAEKTVASLAIR